MASQPQRGYQYGASRGIASGRTDQGREISSGGRDREGIHLLPPGSTSGFSRGTPASTRGQTSAFASAASQYTPEVVLTEAEYQAGEEEDLASSSEDEEEGMEGTEGYKSSAERLAEKRKMKRFRLVFSRWAVVDRLTGCPRLTHAQTRYLMNEFARQAHPNAEQRERLSRDIPGLTPRQVQVWFQNRYACHQWIFYSTLRLISKYRRAKLKRLTTDDQERMMRSRALPEDFDFAHTLQPDLRDTRSPYETIPSLNNLSLTGGGMQQRPALELDSQRRNVAPTAMSSVYTNFSPTVGSAAGSANLSPVSSINEGSQYSGSQYSEHLSPLTTSTHLASPFSRSNSLSAPSQGHQRQVEQSRQRSATYVQPSPAFVGNAGAYRDYEPESAPHTPYLSQISSQRAKTFSQGPQPPHMVSPFDPSNTAAYHQRQATYPQPAVAPGYYGPSYAAQNVEHGGWQSGQLESETFRYDPSNPSIGAFRIPPTRQPYSNPNPGLDPHAYDHVSSYQYAGDPRFLAEPGRQPFPAPSDTHAASGAGRRRGGNLPGYGPGPR